MSSTRTRGDFPIQVADAIRPAFSSGPQTRTGECAYPAATDRRTDGSPMGGFTDLDVTGDEHAPEAPELRRSRS
jgi:hypothetical protein